MQIPRSFTPSAAERIAACPASAALPQTYQPSGPAAIRGSAIHDVAADMLTEGREAALAKVPQTAEWRRTVEGFDPFSLALPWDGIRHVEVAYAYDLAADRGRVLGYRIGRRYPPTTPAEIRGSADVVIEARPGLVLVDWKSGQRLESAPDNWQIRIYSLMAARAHQQQSVRGVLAYIAEDGSVELDSADFDAMDLAAIAADLRGVVVAVAAAVEALKRGESPAVTPGDHCRWCPAKPACPAFARELAAATAAPAPAWLSQFEAEIATDEGFARWYRDRLPVLRDVTKMVEDTLRQRALSRGEIPFGDGSRLRASTQTRTTLHAETVLEVLAAQTGSREKAEALCRDAGAYRTSKFPTLRVLNSKERKSA